MNYTIAINNRLFEGSDEGIESFNAGIKRALRSIRSNNMNVLDIEYSEENGKTKLRITTI